MAISKFRRLQSLGAALALVGLAALSACGEPASESAASDGKFRVVTTFTVIQDIAQNVAGDKAVVESITKPGAEIHDYQPTPLDIVKAQDADLVLWMIDATAPAIADNCGQSPSSPPQIRVFNKIDVVELPAIADGVALSAKTGEGVSELVDILARRAEEGLAAGEPAVITRARHRAELEAAAEALERYRAERGGPEIKAEELRVAARHLGRLTGRIDVEEVLGAIFSEFCIGK